jgi:hypothetical protein
MAKRAREFLPFRDAPDMRSILILLHVGVFSLGSLAADSPQFISRPEESVLLLDSHTVAQTDHLTQRFFPAQKHPANPVMRRTEPWEGVGPYLFGNRVMQDEKTGQLRMWYIAYDFNGNFYRWGYAVSPDGLRWTKPDLGIEKFGSGLAKNCLPLGPHPEKATRSIARDPRPETPSHRRYLGVRFTYDGEFVSFSPDGIAWLEYPLNPAWKVPSDIIHILWDERRNHFTAYYKIWEVTGSEVSADGAADKPFIAYMPTFMPKKLTNGVEQFEGPRVYFHTNGAAEVKTERFLLRSESQGHDDGGGTSLSGAWTAKRVQAWAESEDGIHWKNEQVVLRADTQDPATANIQYMFVMTYGAYYLGFLTMHDEAGYFRIQLAWSSNGLQWNRSWRQPWLDVGSGKDFDRGMVLGPADPIFHEKEIWFPYGGFPIRHDSPATDWESAIGLATMRLDGFSAWQAENETGELMTQPFRCAGDRLFINAEAQTGFVQVEVLDEKGIPIKGFEMKSCRSISADTLAHESDGWVIWRRAKDLRAVEGKLIQLRFRLQNARLFSFRIADERTMKLRDPRATVN